MVDHDLTGVNISTLTCLHFTDESWGAFDFASNLFLETRPVEDHTFRIIITDTVMDEDINLFFV
jgi:hypothetical protein